MGKVTRPVIPLRESVEEAIHSYNHHPWGAIMCQQSLHHQSLPNHWEGIWEDIITQVSIHCFYKSLGKKHPSYLAIPEIAYDSQSSSILSTYDFSQTPIASKHFLLKSIVSFSFVPWNVYVVITPLSPNNGFLFYNPIFTD